jgi:hypothetical protein
MSSKAKIIGCSAALVSSLTIAAVGTWIVVDMYMAFAPMIASLPAMVSFFMIAPWMALGVFGLAMSLALITFSGINVYKAYEEYKASCAQVTVPQGVQFQPLAAGQVDSPSIVAGPSVSISGSGSISAISR